MLQAVVYGKIAQGEFCGVRVCSGDLRRGLVQPPREVRVDVQGVHEAIHGLLLGEVLAVVRKEATMGKTRISIGSLYDGNVWESFPPVGFRNLEDHDSE